MTLSRRLINILYSVSRISAGLFLHPYQTMQSLIEDRQLVWLSLMPSLILGVITVVWRVVVVPVVQTFSSCTQVAPWICPVLNWAADWLVSLVIIWQIVLLYLLFRFNWVRKKWRRDH